MNKEIKACLVAFLIWGSYTMGLRTSCRYSNKCAVDLKYLRNCAQDSANRLYDSCCYYKNLQIGVLEKGEYEKALSYNALGDDFYLRWEYCIAYISGIDEAIKVHKKHNQYNNKL